jgi:hypothetical protein
MRKFSITGSDLCICVGSSFMNLDVWIILLNNHHYFACFCSMRGMELEMLTRDYIITKFMVHVNYILISYMLQ